MREAAKQFRSGKNDQVRCRKTKSARQRAENKIDIFERARLDDFAEAARSRLRFENK